MNVTDKLQNKFKQAKQLLTDSMSIRSSQGEFLETIDWWTKYYTSIGEEQAGPEVLNFLYLFLFLSLFFS